MTYSYFDFTIQYKTGNTHVVTDALSRIPPPASCLLLTVPPFVFLNELMAHLSNNPEFQKLKLAIAQQPSSHTEYQEHQDLIFFKEQIWLPL
jgi:hypothetical protein